MSDVRWPRRFPRTTDRVRRDAIAIAIASALALAVALAPSAAPAAGVRPPDAWWHDGRERRPLWLDDRHVAEFPAAAGTTPDRKPAMPGATQGAAGAGPRIKSAATPATTGTLQSPVFRDSASLGGTPRALPGGVLVTFATPMDDTAARARLQGDGLVPVRAIVAGRTWLVASPPGVAALQLAGRLHDGGRYASVQPNWWQPRALK